MRDEVVQESIVVTLTQRCNLKCTYCYEHKKDRAILSVRVALDAIDKAFRKGKGDLSIALFGGEPFLAFQEMKEIVEGVMLKEQARPYSFSVITNGTLLNEKMKSWLASKRDRIRVDLSLDGPPEIHNMNRPGSFEKIDLDFFRKIGLIILLK